MGKMMGNGSDVVSFLKEQHEQIKTLFGTVAATRGKERANAFYALRRLLAVHETAEEEIIHPAARRALPQGEAVIEARLREEKQAKKILVELEKLDVDSPAFESQLRTLELAVVAHADAEEREELERLAVTLEPARLDRMRRATELAELMAPTRPHPGVESAAANLLIGPFASMLDRARDVLSGKTGKA